MELELLEILPNGRKIYFRPQTNRSVVKQLAINIDSIWRESANKTAELKPLFQDQVGRFWEIEAGGKQFQTADNPKGYKFANYVKHLKRNLKRRGINKDATVLLSQVEEATRQVFPGLSKKENKLFAKGLLEFNELEIGRIIASRKTDESTDHVRSLAKGGLNWFSNLLNIKTPLNLTKGAKDLPATSLKDINNPADTIETIKASLSSDIIKGNPKYKAQVIANAFKGETAKKIKKGNLVKKGGIGSGIFALLDAAIPGDASAEQFQSAIHEGGSWAEALQTYGSEKKSEVGTALTTAPAFMAASRIPFAAGAFKAAAPAFALYSVIYALDKADDIFLDGATKKFLEKYEPGKHIHEGSKVTSMKGDFDFKENKSIQYNSNVIQDKETGEWHSYQIPKI